MYISHRKQFVLPKASGRLHGFSWSSCLAWLAGALTPWVLLVCPVVHKNTWKIKRKVHKPKQTQTNAHTHTHEDATNSRCCLKALTGGGISDTSPTYQAEKITSVGVHVATCENKEGAYHNLCWEGTSAISLFRFHELERLELVQWSTHSTQLTEKSSELKAEVRSRGQRVSRKQELIIPEISARHSKNLTDFV